MSLKAHALFALAAVAVVLIGIAAIALVNFGGDQERQAQAIEIGESNVAIGGANTRVAQHGAREASAHSARELELQQEAADARREIEGSLGADELVAPDVARAIVCRLQRVRHEALTACPSGG